MPSPLHSLSLQRAATESSVRSLRLRAASEALRACGLSLASPSPDDDVLGVLRAQVQALRLSLRDGSDEPRYAATGVALTALGALWAAS